ncbi:MAG: hypothetical protein A3G38_03745 [Omnitrophica WOR_2 bacterium RIFCSPLOWO2_12_FULL_51_8]|nr:MAG: hypothetical protein A3G38_03745 [Omnitrophica WOR_2 bacterium RIFCSPLOWO2_12_FULL_51_8]
MGRAIKNILQKIAQQGLDGLLVSSGANISYLTRTLAREAYLLISRNKSVYFTDSRYIEEAKNALGRNFRLIKTNGSAFSLIARECLELELKRIGFEGRLLPFAEYKKIQDELGRKARLAPAHGLVEGLREVKSPEEIRKIRRAIAVTSAALEFAQKSIRPGKKELEIAGELERFIRYHGASGSAFEIIVASGPNSSLPHHMPGRRVIRKDEPVMIDIGVDYLGYKSDLTRMFFSGKIKGLVKIIYDIVLEAQRKALQEIGPAKNISTVDAAGRQHIFQKGYGKFFGHSLGHGVGLEVHEEPHITAKNTSPLTAGMVITIEPAIYLPGKFGIRIEDMVLVTKAGMEVLSGAVHK